MEKNKKFLNDVETIYNKSVPTKLHLDKKLIAEYNKGLSPKDFNISKGHTLEEYFRKYGRKLKSAKVLTYHEDELWLMNKRTKYWEIKNDSEATYFAVPNKLSNYLAPALVVLGTTVLIVGALVGVYEGVKYFKNKNAGVYGNILVSPAIEPLVVTKNSDGADYLYFNRNSSAPIPVFDPYSGSGYYQYESPYWKYGATYRDNVYVSTDGTNYKLIENYALSYNESSLDTDSSGRPILRYGVRMNKGDKLYIIRTSKSMTGVPLFDFSIPESRSFTFELSGNLGALLNGEQEIPTPMIPTEGVTYPEAALEYMANVFAGCAGLTSAENLVIPFTNFEEIKNVVNEDGDACIQGHKNTFWNMFFDCRRLKVPPKLPSFNHIEHLAQSMFYNCSNLKIGKIKSDQVTDEKVFYTCTESNSYMFKNIGSSFDEYSQAGYSYFVLEE